MFFPEKQGKTQFVYKSPKNAFQPLEKPAKKCYYFMLRKHDPEDLL